MAKPAVCVVLCSLFILILFGVFCFLMSTVNPEKLEVDEQSKNMTKSNAQSNIANFYLRDMDPSDDVEYGLEKSYVSANLRASSGTLPNKVNLTNLPTLKHKNPYLVKVYPPIWPPSMRSTTLKRTHKFLTETTKTNTKATTSVFNNLTITSTIIADTTAKLLESPIHRRSINAFEKRINRDTGSVILKILDDDGQARIEIKLSPNDIFERKKLRTYRSSVKIDSKFSMVIEGDDDDDDRNVVISELPDNTEIKILPNDTVVIANEDHDLRPVEFTTKTDTTNETSTIKYVDKEATGFTTNLEASTVAMSKENKTIERDIRQRQQGKKEKNSKTNTVGNTTLISNLKENNVIVSTPSNTTELLGLKVQFDNITRSFMDPYHIYVSQNKTT